MTRLTKMILVPTKDSYKPMYHRTYELSATDNTLRKLSAVYTETGMGENDQPILENVMSSIAPELISVSDNVIGEAKIINGWNTKRLRFILVAESESGNNVIVSYIQGYTDAYDPSYTGTLDPNMMCIINSITTVIRTLNPVTNEVIIRPGSTFNVVKNEFGQNMYSEIQGPEDDLVLQRPSDILTSYLHLEAYGTDSIIEPASSIANNVETSDRRNNDPVKFLSKTINSVIESKAATSISHASTVTDILKKAAINTKETPYLNNPFIYELFTLTGEANSTSFTLSLLDSIDNSLNVTVIPESNMGATVTVPHNSLLTSDSEDLYMPTFENKVAINITNTLSSVMTDNLITKIALNITNISGEYVVTVSDYRSLIEGINTTAYVNKLIAYVKMIMMPQLTYNNEVIITAYIIADLLGETNISLSINNNPLVVYTLATFSDSIYIPTLTTHANKNSMVDGIANVLEEISAADGDEVEFYY